MSESEEQAMTLVEVAQYLKVSPSLINRLLKQNKIPSFRMGSAHRFWKSEIDKWTREGGAEE